MTIFLMACLIISSLSISIINSIIDKEELKIKEGNIGYSYSKIINYALWPLNKDITVKNLDKNDYYKRYESLLSTQIVIDGVDAPMAIVKANFNYLDKLTVLSVIDASDMKNSVAMGNKLYEKLGKPKKIKIFNRQYKVSHILGEKNGYTDFEDYIVMNYKILSAEDKESFILADNNMIKFLNINSSSSMQNKILASFNGVNSKSETNKTDFKVQNTEEGTQMDIKKAYERQRDSISNKTLLIIIGLCNIIIVSTFWIIDRRKEIAIRKAFGANRMQITLMIFKELFILAIAASTVSIILQYIFMFLGGYYFDVNLKPTIMNVIVVSISAFIVSIITAIIPVKNALDMEISQCLKG